MHVWPAEAEHRAGLHPRTCRAWFGAQGCRVARGTARNNAQELKWCTSPERCSHWNATQHWLRMGTPWTALGSGRGAPSSAEHAARRLFQGTDAGCPEPSTMETKPAWAHLVGGEGGAAALEELGGLAGALRVEVGGSHRLAQTLLIALRRRGGEGTTCGGGGRVGQGGARGPSPTFLGVPSDACLWRTNLKYCGADHASDNVP